jgi:hypothetical protein
LGPGAQSDLSETQWQGEDAARLPQVHHVGNTLLPQGKGFGVAR